MVETAAGLPSSSCDGFHYKATSTVQRVGFDDCAIFLERGHSPIQHKLAQSLLPHRFWVKTFLMQTQRQLPLANAFPQLCWRKSSRSPVLLAVLQWAPTTQRSPCMSGDTAFVLPGAVAACPHPALPAVVLNVRQTGEKGLRASHRLMSCSFWCLFPLHFRILLGRNACFRVPSCPDPMFPTIVNYQGPG